MGKSTKASLIVATNINDAKTTRQNKSNNMITAKLCWDNNDCSSLPLKLQANDYKVDQRCILIDNAVTMRQRLEVQSNESANDCSNFNQIKINNQIAESIRQVIELEQQIHIHQACSPSSSPKTVVEPLESAYCHTSSKFQTQYKQKIQHSSISNGQSFKLEQSNNGDATELSSSILQEKNQLKRNSLIRRSSIRSPRQNSWRNSRTKHPFSEFATLDNIMAEVADEEQLANNVSLQNDCNSNALPSVENSLTELFILGARNDHYEYQTAVMREDSQYILPSPRLFMDRRKAQHLSLKATVKDHSTNDYFQAKRRPLTYHPSNKYSDNSGDDDDDDNHRFNRLSSVVQLQTPCDSGIANIPVTPTTSRSISFPLTLPTSPIASPRSVHRANLISADAGTIRPSSLFYDDSDNDEPNPSNVQSDVQLKTKINTLSNSNATTTTADHANTTHLKHSKVAAYLPSIVHGHSSPILSMEPNYIILKKNTSYIN
ncbi:hypothetical protein BDF19DRAFT_219133 [Syncephalis fuscata]|nr:hypothetical protein BDF19DRAFT_219133 [Syncephalis fuscata]